MRRSFPLALAGLMLLVAACSGAGVSNDVGGELSVTNEGSSPATTVTAAAGDEASASNNPPTPTGVPGVGDRKVIYNGQIQLEAADTRATFDAIVALVQSSGGFVAATNIGENPEGDDQPIVSLTVRLPADRLTATLAGIRGLADKVVTESLQSQDVTDQFVDIDAQLRNLNALETELLGLLAELKDNNNADPAKLLQVFDQIRITRGEIEQLEGRRQLLTDLVSLATLQIGIAPLPAAAPIVPEDPAWEPGTQARGALRDLVEAMQGVGTFLIRFGLYVFPILIVTLGPIGLLAWFFLRRSRKQQPTTPANSEVTAPAP